MINYADYTFYTTEYKGNLSIGLFNSLIIKASREIDKYVNRILTEDAVNNLSFSDKWQLNYVACRLCDFINENGSRKVTSISIDGVSKSFKSETEIQNEKKSIINNLPLELTRYLWFKI